LIRLIAVLLSVLFLWGCSETEKKEKPLTESDSLRIKYLQMTDSVNQILEVKKVEYRAVIAAGQQTVKELREVHGDSAASIILALNRVDAKHVRAKDTLIVPDTITTNMLLYSPFPLILKSAAEIPRILFISQEIQAFAAYYYGILVRWGPTSTGKRSTPTPNGLFHTNWKAKETISTFNDEWILKWSFNIENFEGISIHEYAMPGYPASHACARLLESDAFWFYHWAEQWILSANEVNIIAYGTPVILFGKYAFGSRRPWRQLAEDPEAVHISEKQLKEITSGYLEEILKRQSVRDSVLASRSN
jgi:lipoprotein-anchoring transpeptidase ErfK/SrfK